MDRCDSCRFIYADVAAPVLPARLAAFGAQYAALLLPPGRSAAWFGILRTRPEEVTEQLATAARLIAQAFAGLDAAQLQRRCIYNFPAPTERSLLWVGQHAIHEGEHHFRDIERGIARVRAPAG